MNLKILILNENNLNPRIINSDISFDKIIFPWDAPYFEKQNYSLKQLVFIYECLISFDEIDIEINEYSSNSNKIIRTKQENIGISLVDINLTSCPKFFGDTGELLNSRSFLFNNENSSDVIQFTTILDDSFNSESDLIVALK